MKKKLYILYIALFSFIGNINAQCNADFSVLPASASICSGNTVNFTNKSTGVFAHSWDFGDATSSGTTNPSHSYVNTGSSPITFDINLYLDCLTDGTKDTASLTITVNPSTEAAFSLNKTETCAITDSICPNNLTQNLVGNQYFWDFGTPPIITDKDPCFTYYSNDTFDIQLIVVNQYGCEDRHNEQIIIKETPNTDFSIVPFAGCVPLSVNFFNTTGVGTSPIVNWEWDLANGDTSYLQTPSSVIYPVVDTFFVSLEATNQTGCKNKTVKPVLVGPEVIVDISSPDSVCPNDFITLSATTSIPVSYTQWFVQDGIFQSGNLGSTVNVKWNSGGLKQIIAKGVLTGCDSYDTTNVFVNPIYNIDYFYTDSNVVCPGEDVLVGVMPLGFQQYTFLNILGDTIQSSNSNGYFFTNLQNSINFSVNGIDYNGCEVIGANQPITVNVIPDVTLSSGSVSNTFCYANDVTITANPNGILNYDFYQDFSLVQTGGTNTYLVDSLLTNSTFFVETTDGLCYKNSDTILITLVDSILTPQANCGATTLNSIDFVWDSVMNSLGYEVSIDGGVFTAPNGTLTHSETGLTAGDSMTFVVKAIAGNPCNDITISDTIVCYAIDCPLLNFDLNYDPSVCEGDSLKVKAENIISQSDSIGFRWDGGSFSSDSTYFIFPVGTANISFDVVMIDSAGYFGGCPPILKKVQVNPISKNELTLLPLDSICEFDNVDLIASPSTFTNYDFYIDGMLVQSSLFAAYTLDSVSGTYNLRIEAIDSKCALNPLDTNLTFAPPTSLSLQSLPDSICYNSALSIVASPNTMTEYTFFRDNISVQASSSNTLNLDSVIVESEIFVLAKEAKCLVQSDTMKLNLVDSISKPIVSCGTATLNSVDFNWNSLPNVQGYEVSVNNGPFTTSSSGNVGLNHFLGSLSPSENVTIVVKATAQAPCNDVILSDSLVCKTLDCPNLNFDLVYNDTSYCEGDSLIVTASNFVSNSDSIGFSWNGLPFGTDTIFIIPVLDSLDVNFNVEMIDSSTYFKGCPTVNENVFVNPISTNELFLSLPNPICENTDIDLTALPNSFFNYEFIINSVSAQDSIINIYNLMDVSGSYTVKVIAIDGKCPLDPFDTTITINPLPIVSLVSDQANDSICEGEYITLTALPAGLISYQFYQDSILVQDSLINTYSDSIDTNPFYQFHVFGIDNFGCRSESSDTLFFIIVPKPIFTLDTMTIKARPCDTAMFSVKVNKDTFDIYQFEWNDSTFSSNTGYLEGIIDSIAKISVTVESFFACKTSDSVTFIDPILPPESVLGRHKKEHFGCNKAVFTIYDFDLTLMKTYIDSLGGFFQFEGGLPIPYDSLDSLVVTHNVEFPEETTEEYISIITRLLYIDSTGCEKNLSISDSILIPKFLNGYDTLLCLYEPGTKDILNTSVSAYNENTTGGFFKWDSIEFITNNYSKFFNFQPNAPGSYSFPFYECLGDSGVCCNKESFDFCIPDCNPFIPNAISPNNDDKNQNWELFNLWGKIKISIYNRWGELVFEKIDYQNDWNGVDKNGNDLPVGVYFYVIEVDGYTYKVNEHESEPDNYQYFEVQRANLFKNIANVISGKDNIVFYQWTCEQVPYEPIKGTIIIER